MKIVIVGSGNVATVLSALIYKAGHEIMQVVSRNVDHAVILASKYNVEGVAMTRPEFAEADLYIIALSDAALSSIDNISALSNKFLVHTAGSVSMEIFSKISTNYGVLYPLQSLSKSITTIPKIPFLIEGNSPETRDQLMKFAGTISEEVISANESERLNYHIAAIFTSNFTNHLYAVTEEFCSKERIDFKNLLPLINEVTLRINNNSPYDVQTGPAIREDIFTINRHLQKLTSFPDLKYLYLKLSESILKLHDKK